MTPELIISPSELKTLTIKGKVSIYINHLHNQLQKSTVSEDKKQMTYKIISLLDECSKVISDYQVADSKRRSNNFELQYKYKSLLREVEQLKEENKTLKSNL